MSLLLLFNQAGGGGGTVSIPLVGIATAATLGALTAVQLRPDPNPPIDWPVAPANANISPLDPAVAIQSAVSLRSAPQDANRNPLGPQPGPTE